MLSSDRRKTGTGPVHFADIVDLASRRRQRDSATGTTLQQMIDNYDASARAATPSPSAIAAPRSDRDLLQLLDRMAAFHSGAGLSSAEQALARPADNSMIAQLAAAR